MKKTLLALSVLVAAGAVNAAEVYNQDGFTVDVYGDAEVKLVDSYKKTDGGEDSDAQFQIGDSDFGFKSTSEINDEYTAYATIEFDGDDGTNDGTSDVDVKLDDLFVGVKGNGFSVQVGKQITLVDDIGISNDTTFGLDTAENEVGLFDSGKQVTTIRYAQDMFSVGLSYARGSDGDASTDDIRQHALTAGLTIDALELNVWYVDQSDGVYDKAGTPTTLGDKNAFAAKGAYSFDSLTLSVLYVAAEDELSNKDYDSIAGNIQYTMDKYEFNLGAANNDEDGSEDVTTWYGNVKYSLATNTKLILELADSNDDDATDGLGYSLGMTYAF